MAETIKVEDSGRQSNGAEGAYVGLVHVKICFDLIRGQFGKGQPGEEESREFPIQKGAEEGGG